PMHHAPPDTSTLSLHDALPISRLPSVSTEATTRSISAPATPVVEVSLKEISRKACLAAERDAIGRALEQTGWNRVRAAKALKIRSEEHTSELQSRVELVCRLLL